MNAAGALPFYQLLNRLEADPVVVRVQQDLAGFGRPEGRTGQTGQVLPVEALRQATLPERFQDLPEPPSGGQFHLQRPIQVRISGDGAGQGQDVLHLSLVQVLKAPLEGFLGQRVLAHVPPDAGGLQGDGKGQPGAEGLIAQFLKAPCGRVRRDQRREEGRVVGGRTGGRFGLRRPGVPGGDLQEVFPGDKLGRREGAAVFVLRGVREGDFQRRLPRPPDGPQAGQAMADPNRGLPAETEVYGVPDAGALYLGLVDDEAAGNLEGGEGSATPVGQAAQI